MKRLTQAAVLLLGMLLISGCLEVREKDYHFSLLEDGTMQGTIVFHDFVSLPDDGNDVSEEDFQVLLEEYVQGHVYEDDHPRMDFFNKRFYLEEDLLNAIVDLNLADPAGGGFMIDAECECADIYLILLDDYIPILSCNGEIDAGGNFIRWPAGTTEFKFQVGSNSDFEGSVSLADRYEAWLQEGEQE